MKLSPGAKSLIPPETSPISSFTKPTKASTLAENRTEQEMPDKPEQKEIILKETILGEIPVERASKQEEIQPKPMVTSADSREKNRLEVEWRS
jgi:hypothetical protein